jgi:hypothetical protein
MMAIIIFSIVFSPVFPVPSMYAWLAVSFKPRFYTDNYMGN